MSKSDRGPPHGVDAKGDADAPRQTESSALPRVVRGDALLGGALQLAILHNETLYFLRETRFGKLILTK
jgi:hemin uptake protein HemP